MTEPASPQPRAFLSYSRRDGADATRVFDALTAAGVDVFRDTEDILPAEDWRDRLRGLITSADAVVFLMSPHSVRSEICSWEVEYADDLNKRLVPVLLAPVEEADTPAAIARLNYVFATPEHDFDDAIGRITSAVSTDIGWVRDHTRYGERAEEWARARATGGANRALLLRGGALAEAEAWLGRQPGDAPPPSPQAREWIAMSRSAATRRQRVWVAGSLAVAAVSIGLGVFAEMNRRIAAEQRDRAERILDSGSQTANDLVFDMAQRFRDRSGVPQELVQDLLGRSKALLDQLAEAGEARPDLRRSRAAALTEMSVTLARQGALDDARAAAAEATAAFRSLLSGGGAEARADLAVGLDREGDVLLQAGDADAAAARFREALALNTALVAADPRPIWRGNLAVSEEKAGDLAALSERHEEALAAYDRALDLRRAIDGVERGVAVLLEKRADMSAATGDEDGALDAYRQSLAMTKALAEQAPENTRLVRDQSVIHQKLGDLLLATDGPEAAEPHFDADLDIARRLHAADPGREDWALDLTVSLDRSGVLAYQLGDADRAAALLAEAFDVSSARAAAKPERTDLQGFATKASQKLSLVSFAAGDFDRAAGAALADEQRLGEAVAAGAPLADAHGDAVNNVAWYSLFTDHPERALSAARRAVEINPDAAIYRLNLAHALLVNGRVDDALAVYRSDEGEQWAAMIVADFEQFEAYAVAPDLIDRARRALLD